MKKGFKFILIPLVLAMVLSVGITASAEDCWTGLYAVFTIAWDVKIDYHI